MSLSYQDERPQNNSSSDDPEIVHRQTPAWKLISRNHPSYGVARNSDEALKNISLPDDLEFAQVENSSGNEIGSSKKSQENKSSRVPMVEECFKATPSVSPFFDDLGILYPLWVDDVEIPVRRDLMLQYISQQDDSNSAQVEISTGNEIRSLKGNKLAPVPNALKRKRNPMVEESLTSFKAKCKTTLIPLSEEDINSQFGKTMKEAAKNLNVSVSTLKRKCKVLGLSEWHGKDYLKRKVNELFNNQSDTSEDEAIQDNRGETYLDENTLTIKAEYEGDMIKFHLPMSSETLVAIEKEIYKGFKLNPGDYKLKYLDEEEDWILITSDTNIRGCIKNRRNSTSTAIRMLLLPRKT